MNHEVGELLRIMGDAGQVLRLESKKERKLKLKERVEVGRALNSEEEIALMEGASKATSPFLFPAIAVALNTAMRDSEIKSLAWRQIDLQERILTVGKSKTAQGQGRTIPIVGELERILFEHRNWYQKNIAEALPHHFVFPFWAGASLAANKGDHKSQNRLEEPQNQNWDKGSVSRSAAHGDN